MPSEAEVEVLNIEVSSEWNDTPRRGVKTLLKCLDKLKRIETELSTEKFANMSGISNAMNKIHNAVKPLENANLKNVVSSLGRLQKVISGYDEDISSFSRSMDDIKNGISKLNTENNVEDVSKKLRKLQKTLTSYKDIDNDAFANTISTMNNTLPRIQLKDATNDLTKPITLLKRLPKVLDEYNTLNLEGLKKAYSELAKMVNLMKELNNVPNMKDFIASVKLLQKYKLENPIKESDELSNGDQNGELLRKKVSIYSKLIDKLKDKFLELEKYTTGATHEGEKAWKRLLRVARGAIKIFSNIIGKFSILALKTAIVKIVSAMIREIRDMVKEGINNFYQYSKAAKGSFADAMDRIATSSLYVKNAFGSLVGQLIQRVAPYLEWVFDKIADCVNKMSEFYAKLTGAESWTRAKKVPIEFAEATENAVNSTEKLKRAILGFDKLNILDFGTQLEKASKAKAPTVSKQYSMMFEEVKIVDNGSIDRVKGKYSGLYDALNKCKTATSELMSKIFTNENKENFLNVSLNLATSLSKVVGTVVDLLNKLKIPEIFINALIDGLAVISDMVEGLLTVVDIVTHPKTFLENSKEYSDNMERLIELTQLYDKYGTKYGYDDIQTKSLFATANQLTGYQYRKELGEILDELEKRINKTVFAPSYTSPEALAKGYDYNMNPNSPEALAKGYGYNTSLNNQKQAITVNVNAEFGASDFTQVVTRQQNKSGELLLA